MDPNQTYLDMLAAVQNQDFEAARELALALKDWFARGGFYPYQYTPETLHSAIANVLRRTTGDGAEPVFSLVCRYCDAGEDMTTQDEAIAVGWTDIELALALPQTNFCGVCPDCQELEG